jgi:hypothetical protein
MYILERTRGGGGDRICCTKHMIFLDLPSTSNVLVDLPTLTHEPRSTHSTSKDLFFPFFFSMAIFRTLSFFPFKCSQSIFPSDSSSVLSIELEMHFMQNSRILPPYILWSELAELTGSSQSQQILSSSGKLVEGLEEDILLETYRNLTDLLESTLNLVPKQLRE